MSIAEKLQTIAENEQKVYEAGYAKGKSEGGGGGDSYYDVFWDNYQLNGSRTSYSYAFYTSGWNDTTFKPKYNIVAKSADYMFQNSKITNLKEILANKGVTLDVSQCTQPYGIFYYTAITHIPEINLENATKINNMFYGSKNLVSVDKLILSSGTNEKTVQATNAFVDCTELENIIIEGIINTGTFDFRYSQKLNYESIKSIINALSTTTSGYAVTLSKTAVDTAFETSSGANDGSTSAEWLALIATKTNWTISLS